MANTMASVVLHLAGPSTAHSPSPRKTDGFSRRGATHDREDDCTNPPQKKLTFEAKHERVCEDEFRFQWDDFQV